MADVLTNRSVLLTTVEVFSIIIFNVLSLTGNIMVCIAVSKNTRLRTTTNLYIIALALSDLMSGVFLMPFSLGVLITGEWVYGWVICNFQAYMVMFVVYVSPVTMGLTAFNRYMWICKSEQQRWSKMIRQRNAAMSSTIHSGATGSSITVQELKLTKSLFVVVFAFMICWIPFWVIVVVRHLHVVEKLPRNIELLACFFIYLSNTINPFIYAGMNRTFRSEFRKMFCCERRLFNCKHKQNCESNTEKGRGQSGFEMYSRNSPRY